MSKDYKKSIPKKSGARAGGSPLLTGILIGLLLGLLLALGIAWYLNRMPTPFLRPPVSGGETRQNTPQNTVKNDDKAADGKPRFDFYKILPGTEETVTEQQFKEAQKSSTAAGTETFFLQAGAFQSAPEADNLKARLALLGLQASIQTSNMPDKAPLHRVRLGPYSAVADLNEARNTLKQNGIETTLIKVRGAPAQPSK